MVKSSIIRVKNHLFGWGRKVMVVLLDGKLEAYTT